MAKNLGAEAKGATQQAAEAILKGGGSQPLITVWSLPLLCLLIAESVFCYFYGSLSALMICHTFF